MLSVNVTAGDSVVGGCRFTEHVRVEDGHRLIQHQTQGPGPAPGAPETEADLMDLSVLDRL